MTVYSVILLPKIPFLHCVYVYMVLSNPPRGYECSACSLETPFVTYSDKTAHQIILT